MFRKGPVRTYERKKAGGHVTSMATTTIRDDVPPDRNPQKIPEALFGVEDSDMTMDYDPFETTFDRIIKTAVMPKRPEIPESGSYDSSSSDSDAKSADAEDIFSVPTVLLMASPVAKKRRVCKRKEDTDLDLSKVSNVADIYSKRISRINRRSALSDENANPNGESASFELASKKQQVTKKRTSITDYRGRRERSLNRSQTDSSIETIGQDQFAIPGPSGVRCARGPRVVKDIILTPSIKKHSARMKDPIVSLTRLDDPGRLSVANKSFMNSTPITLRPIRTKSVFHVSPIEKNQSANPGVLHGDANSGVESFPAKLLADPAKSYPEASDRLQLSQEMSGRIGKRSLKLRSTALSDSPAPEPSGLLFDDTDVAAEDASAPPAAPGGERASAPSDTQEKCSNTTEDLTISSSKESSMESFDPESLNLRHESTAGPEAEHVSVPPDSPEKLFNTTEASTMSAFKGFTLKSSDPESSNLLHEGTTGPVTQNVSVPPDSPEKLADMTEASTMSGFKGFSLESSDPESLNLHYEGTDNTVSSPEDAGKSSGEMIPAVVASTKRLSASPADEVNNDAMELSTSIDHQEASISSDRPDSSDVDSQCLTINEDDDNYDDEAENEKTGFSSGVSEDTNSASMSQTASTENSQSKTLNSDDEWSTILTDRSYNDSGQSTSQTAYKPKQKIRPLEYSSDISELHEEGSIEQLTSGDDTASDGTPEFVNVSATSSILVEVAGDKKEHKDPENPESPTNVEISDNESKDEQPSAASAPYDQNSRRLLQPFVLLRKLVLPDVRSKAITKERKIGEVKNSKTEGRSMEKVGKSTVKNPSPTPESTPNSSVKNSPARSVSEMKQMKLHSKSISRMKMPVLPRKSRRTSESSKNRKKSTDSEASSVYKAKSPVLDKKIREVRIILERCDIGNSSDTLDITENPASEDVEMEETTDDEEFGDHIMGSSVVNEDVGSPKKADEPPLEELSGRNSRKGSSLCYSTTETMYASPASSMRKDEQQKDIEEAQSNVGTPRMTVKESSEIQRNETDPNATQSSSSIPLVLLDRLNDPVGISLRRRKKLNNLSVIPENRSIKTTAIIEEIDEETETLPYSSRITQERPVRLTGEMMISQQTTASGRSSIFSNLTGASRPGEMDDKPLFLKPGKSWARSLSILSSVHSQEDVESLAVGKGKKWRESVNAIFQMQQQGLLQSCVKKNEDDKESRSIHGVRSSTATWTSDSSQSDTSRVFSTASPGRFARRVSIRVVPDSKNLDNLEDTAFLEAYGIPPSQNRQTIGKRSTSLAHRETAVYNLQDVSYDKIPRSIHAGKSRDVVLQQCSQDSSLPFEECYPLSYLKHCRKIGEGVYGEVFLYEKAAEKTVIKIIPIEGEMYVNNERQKKFEEILSEIAIAKELHNLRFGESSRTDSFVEVRNIRCVMGKYPRKLIDLWNTFDKEKRSDNDCPVMFDKNQLYIVLELGHGGEDLEAFVFQNASESLALFMQTAVALAVAEEKLEFEHRDLHWGNILIGRTDESHVEYMLQDKSIRLATKGVKVSVIDFTLSRMSYSGCSIYNDLAEDHELFIAVGEDYQFEIYRLMRDKVENDWQRFEPFTNILWLHYTLDKMITAARYRRVHSKIHKSSIAKLQELKETILDYSSALDFVTNCDKATRLQRSRTSIATVT